MSRKPKVTADRLRELLHYDPVTGIFTRKVGVRGHEAGEVCGGRNNLGYVYVGVDKRLYGAHRLAWLYSYGEWPVGLIDHIDRVRHNNVLSNLREVSAQQNAQNSKAHADAMSAFKGVCRHSSGRWRAEICVAGHRRFLGVFDTEHQAAAAYRAASSELQTHGVPAHV